MVTSRRPAIAVQYGRKRWLRPPMAEPAASLDHSRHLPESRRHHPQSPKPPKYCHRVARPLARVPDFPASLWVTSRLVVPGRHALDQRAVVVQEGRRRSVGCREYPRPHSAVPQARRRMSCRTVSGRSCQRATTSPSRWSIRPDSAGSAPDFAPFVATELTEVLCTQQVAESGSIPAASISGHLGEQGWPLSFHPHGSTAGLGFGTRSRVRWPGSTSMSCPHCRAQRIVDANLGSLAASSSNHSTIPQLPHLLQRLVEVK